MVNIAGLREKRAKIDYSFLSRPEETPITIFQWWCEDLLSTLYYEPTQEAITIAKAELLDRLMKARQDVPKAERNRSGTNDKPSLLSVFEDAYARLRKIELSLPPSLNLSKSETFEDLELGDMVDDEPE